MMKHRTGFTLIADKQKLGLKKEYKQLTSLERSAKTSIEVETL